MTKLLTQNPPRRRIRLTTPEASITDQTLLNEYSMASLKQKLERHLPIGNLTNDAFYSLKPLKYTNLQDALTFHDAVQKEFDSLPSGLRKEMGNDLRNYESFVSDPKNAETLIKYGVIKRPDASNSDLVNAINKLGKMNAEDSKKPASKAEKQPE